MESIADLVLKGKAWPFDEARQLLKQVEKKPAGKWMCYF